MTEHEGVISTRYPQYLVYIWVIHFRVLQRVTTGSKESEIPGSPNHQEDATRREVDTTLE